MQNGYQPRRDQTDDSDRKSESQGRQDFKRGRDKTASCGYCKRNWNITPQMISQHGEKHVESADRRTTLHEVDKFTKIQYTYIHKSTQTNWLIKVNCPI